MYNCALLGVEFEILGEEEEFDYYSDLFQKIKERYRYEAEALFTVMKCNDDYDCKLNEYIEEMEDTGKKRFDFAIMNPPYDRNLHLKFLEKVIKVADKTVNISPVRWLQDPLARYKKNSDWNKFKDGVSDKIEDVKIIPAYMATRYFGKEPDLVITIDLGIYTCTDKGGWKNIYGNSILDKVMNKMQGVPTTTVAKHTAPVFVLVTTIDGGHAERKNSPGSTYSFIRNEKWYGQYYKNGVSDNGFTLEENKKRNVRATNGKTDTWECVEFNTEQEAINFCNSTKTEFFKYVYKTEMVDVNVHPQFLPWMGDYTKPWTNARFCEYFGITGFVSDTEAEPGSEWETILETMKKYA